MENVNYHFTKHSKSCKDDNKTGGIKKREREKRGNNEGRLTS